jgi:DNA-binding HxlR family transcriptional regulator
MRPASQRSVCPIATSLDVFGDKWTLLVIRDLAIGKRFFKDFMQSPEGIATNILADRLQRLVDGGFSKKVPDETPGRDAYELTDLGRSLLPVLLSIAEWGVQHLPGTKPLLKKPLKEAWSKSRS